MDEPTRLTKTKEQWAKARRGGEEREVFYAEDERLPPGQHVVETFPDTAADWNDRFLRAKQEAEERAYHLNADQ